MKDEGTVACNSGDQCYVLDESACAQSRYFPPCLWFALRANLKFGILYPYLIKGITDTNI